MKIRLKAVAGATALAIVAGVLVGGSSAFAAVTPGWEPDADALGSISFYNASGAPVTGGSLSDHPAAWYSVASGAGRAGDNKAQLRAYTPRAGVLPGLWSGDTLTGSTTYPNAGAPAAIASLSLPVASGTGTDLSLAEYIDSLPNTESAAGYANLYELRLYTSGPGQGAGSTYYRADIQVNVTGTSGGLVTGTWQVVYPTPGTATTISASPASSAPAGSSVTLTAQVSPPTAGSVNFFDGSTDLGAASYNASTGVATKVVTPAAGSHSFRAVFTSSDSGVAGSTSSNLAYSIVAGTPTSTDLSASPVSPATADASGNASVTLTSHVTPAGVAGSVHIFDGATDLGAAGYTAATGTATLALNLSSAGSPHYLTATFTPSAAGYTPSTSLVVSYVVVGANSSAISITGQNNTPPYAGALTLQVAAGTSVTLTQVDPSTAAGHPVQDTDTTGHRHAWVFNGGLTGVSVNDTRPSQPGWTVSGQATDFVNGGTTVSAKNLGWTPALASGGDAEGTVTAGGVIASILRARASVGLSNPRTLASAATGNGLGTKNLSAGFEFLIPDTSEVGTYTSTLTLTLVSP